MSWGPIVWLKNQMETIINKNTKWYYSGSTGAKKILIKNVEFVDKEIELTTSSTDKKRAYLVGMFVPKVSGYHKIILAPDTLNADREGVICICTEEEFNNSVTVYNQNTPGDMFSDTGGFKNSISTYLEVNGTTRKKALAKGANVMKLMNNIWFTDGNKIEVMEYCTANEPVYLWFYNDSTNTVTLWSNVVTVEYNLTEPYEY